MVGPIIVIAINAYLLAWALLKKPRDPAYWAFAALGLSLVIWNVGGLLRWFAGEDPARYARLSAAWLRLSFFGVALAPANMLFVSVLAGGRKRLARLQPSKRVSLAYLPAVALGVFADLEFAQGEAAGNSWRRAFYDMTETGSYTMVAVVALYIVASLLLVWPDKQADRQERRQAEVVLRGVVAPFAIGVVAILLLGALRPERAPTAALWMMIVSQVAMFQMARLGWVRLRLTREKGIRLFLVVVIAAASVLLAFALAGWLLQRRFSIETALVLTVALVAFCYIVAVAAPRIEALSIRIAKKRAREQRD